MALKKTDNCCRYCKHRGWGKVHRNQRYESIVCLLKPKVFKNPIDNIEPHYYSTKMTETCENFERRNEQ
jgi:hypothetical protein